MPSPMMRYAVGFFALALLARAVEGFQLRPQRVARAVDVSGRAGRGYTTLFAKRRTNLSKSPAPTTEPEAVAEPAPTPRPPRDDSLIVLRQFDSIEEIERKVSGAQASITSTQVGALSGLRSDFQSDLDDFNNTNKKRKYKSQLPFIGDLSGLVDSAPKVEKERNEVAETLKSVFSSVLIADFFVVIFFLVWFLAAAALQGSYPVVLERFQDLFQPVVVPSLTVLMVGSMASGAMESQANKD
ncbi:hypothetical protein B484DRAFT_456337, partial [Ochromonadaceae sp. CCMP2298]